MRSIRADLLEIGDTLERRAARERMDEEPAGKTDRLLADIAAAPVTGGPTNDATTDAQQGGIR